MKLKTWSTAAATLALLAVAACSGPQPGAPAKTPAAAPQEPAKVAADAEQTATDAYIFGYPLITMEMTRRVMTNVETAAGSRGPMGHLSKLRTYPDAQFRDVTAPNADTLYTIAWLDLAKEPWVLTVPDSAGRYYLLPMLSGWTDVFEVPGTRTSGNGPQKFVISGPGWSGTIPEGFTQLKSPTAMVWMLGRIYSTGTPEDYAATHAMQDAIQLMPLSAFGTAYVPPPGTIDPSVDMKTPVRDQVHAMNAQAYYTLLAELLKSNPPAAADAPMVAQLAKIGIVPGQDFDWSKLDPALQKALEDSIKPTQGKILANFARIGENINGWTYTPKTGVYGTNYIDRATVAMVGLGANRPEDAIYPTSEKDTDGNAYSGANKYVIRFEKGQLPPAAGFWSLTMYDDAYFFTDNELDRYNVSSRSPFVENADGSVDVYIQHDNPGKDKEANWLPAPEGKFVLMMRLYMPRSEQPSILDGSWNIPPVVKVE
jgi:hypothetical protein